MGRLLSAALSILLASGAEAATYSSTPPTTGAPCKQWLWQLYDPSGTVLYERMTLVNWATFPEPDVPQKAICACADSLGRWSEPSVASEPYFPPRLVAQYARAGLTVRIAPLSMNVALIRGVEWVDPNKGD